MATRPTNREQTNIRSTVLIEMEYFPMEKKPRTFARTQDLYHSKCIRYLQAKCTGYLRNHKIALQASRQEKKESQNFFFKITTKKLHKVVWNDVLNAENHVDEPNRPRLMKTQKPFLSENENLWSINSILKSSMFCAFRKKTSSYDSTEWHKN